ncbi:Uncharacterised protein [Bordetella pertussis]|nr:Uncharacterised protein [Bordetella pertussis]CFW33398.1 Uncharacterised protein [Bordetella pertussis]
MPMGVWSTITTSAICSAPSRRSNAPGASDGLPFCLSRAG